MLNNIRKQKNIQNEQTTLCFCNDLSHQVTSPIFVNSSSSFLLLFFFFSLLAASLFFLLLRASCVCFFLFFSSYYLILSPQYLGPSSKMLPDIMRWGNHGTIYSLKITHTHTPGCIPRGIRYICAIPIETSTVYTGCSEHPGGPSGKYTILAYGVSIEQAIIPTQVYGAGLVLIGCVMDVVRMHYPVLRKDIEKGA